MIPIAGVLLLVVALFTVAVVINNPAVFELSIFGALIPVNAAGVYFTGVGATLVLMVAGVLMRRGISREKARRRRVKALKHLAGSPGLGTAPEQTAPGRRVAAPEQTAPGQTAPGQTAPGQTAPEQTAPEQTAPGQTPPGQKTSPTERQALREEAEELTGDDPDR